MNKNVHFRSAHTIWIGAVYWASILLCAWSIWQLVMNPEDTPIGVSIFVFAVVLISGGLLAWIWFDTGYHLEDEVIRYLSGPIKGRIPYESLREIEVGKTLWAGTRPALATG